MSLVVIYTTVIVLFLMSQLAVMQLPNGVFSPVIDVSFAVHVMNPIRVCSSIENVPLNETLLHYFY